MELWYPLSICLKWSWNKTKNHETSTCSNEALVYWYTTISKRAKSHNYGDKAIWITCVPKPWRK